MVRACGIPAKKFCMACFTGDYPVAFAPEDNNKEILEQRRERAVSLVPEEESRQKFLL
jgi:glutamine phosphoribosylpyrophosphate amidotransferase